MRARLLFLSTGLSLAILSSTSLAKPVIESAPKLSYAENFKVEKFPTHTVLTVLNHAVNNVSTQRYALVPRSSEMPDLDEDLQVILTPVQKVVLMETIFIGYLDALEQLDSIVGAATVDFISHPHVNARIRENKIKSIQYGQSMDIESLLLLQPDLILTSISGDPTYDIPDKLARSGLPIVITSGHMENHPLARAEWIKFISYFYDLEASAVESFKRSRSEYEKLVAHAKTAIEQPSVFFGAPYSGAWYIPGGNSITAQAVQDAGGHYIWAENNSRGSIPLNTERVFLKASQADFWLNPSQHRSLNALYTADPRFRKFEAFQNRRVYNNTKQVLESGGNNIWEGGIAQPQEALADLIHIFHPKLLPEHETIYFERLE